MQGYSKKALGFIIIRARLPAAGRRPLRHERVRGVAQCAAAACRALKPCTAMRTRRDPNFFRRYAELQVEEVDRALARLDKMARRMMPKAD